jgi:hypothetical protein
MPTWELKPEFRNDGKIATGPQQIGSEFQRQGGHGGMRVFETRGAKRFIGASSLMSFSARLSLNAGQPAGKCDTQGKCVSMVGTF